MNPNNLNPSEHSDVPTTPTPIVGGPSPQMQATPGTNERPLMQKWLPRLIISALVISAIPTLAELINPEYRSIGESIRNYANIAFIFIFFILIIKIIGSRNAKN